LQPKERDRNHQARHNDFHTPWSIKKRTEPASTAAIKSSIVLGVDIFFNNRIERLIELAARYAIPTMYWYREFAVTGGLISYGISLIEQYRQVGLYAARILKGEKPAELPVPQITKLDLVINLKTTKALGLQVPDRLLALADEVIE